MSDAPTEWSFYHQPLRVAIESKPGNRDWWVDPRISVEQLVLGSNATPSKAVLGVFAGPLNSPIAGSEPALEVQRVLNGQHRPNWAGDFIGPDQEICVFLDRQPGALMATNVQRQVLLHGYCTAPRYDEQSTKTSARTQTQRSFTLTVESMFARLSEMPHAQIHGRFVRKAAAQDVLDAQQERSATTPVGDLGDTIELRTQPCTFNSGGQPNRAAAPVTFTIGGVSHLLHVFTCDGDADGVPWTFAQALRYLLISHLPTEYAGDDLSSMPGPVKDGNGISSTDSLATLSLASRPAAPVAEADAWTYAMLGQPRDLACDGLNMPEALILLADTAGIRFRVAVESEEPDDPNNVQPLRPISRLYFQARGGGPQKELRKEGTFAHRGQSAAELLAKTNVAGLSIQVDYGDVIINPIFVGDVRRYEVTLELLPGWLPDENLDNVAGGAIDAALEYAEAHWPPIDPEDLQADAWFRRHHKGGSQFVSYAQVGRRWVVNTSGRYKAADYARSLGPFDAAAYAPWEPTDADITDTRINDAGDVEVEAVEAGAWVRTPRPLLPCFSADSDKRSLGLVVEFSFDEGSNWYVIPEARIINLADDTGVYLDSDDLTELRLPGADQDDKHWWEAIVRGESRLRVTAVIEGDKPIMPNLDAGRYFPASSTATSKVFNVAHKFHSNRRDGGNSVLAASAPGETIETGDDLEALQSTAETLLDILSARQNSLSATIPYLTTDYQVLDSVLRITGLGMTFHSHGAGRVDRRTDIVAIEYTEGMTRLIFEDPRMLEQLEF